MTLSPVADFKLPGDKSFDFIVFFLIPLLNTCTGWMNRKMNGWPVARLNEWFSKFSIPLCPWRAYPRQDVFPLWSSVLYSFWIPDTVIPMSEPILVESLTPVLDSWKANSNAPSNSPRTCQYSALCLLCGPWGFVLSELILSNIRWISLWSFSLKDHVIWWLSSLASKSTRKPHNWAPNLPSAHFNPSN